MHIYHYCLGSDKMGFLMERLQVISFLSKVNPNLVSFPYEHTCIYNKSILFVYSKVVGRTKLSRHFISSFKNRNYVRNP